MQNLAIIFQGAPTIHLEDRDRNSAISEGVESHSIKTRYLCLADINPRYFSFQE